MTKHIIKLSERTINHMKEFNDRCPTKFIIEDIAKFLKLDCNWYSTSLQDLGVKRGYIDSFNYTIEIHL